MRPSCGPGAFWRGSRPSRTSNVRRCETRLAKSFTLFPGRAQPRVWVAEPGKCRIDEFIRGRKFSAVRLPIEGPAENEFRTTILFQSHLPEPMVDQRRFSDAGPGHNHHDIDVRTCPEHHPGKLYPHLSQKHQFLSPAIAPQRSFPGPRLRATRSDGVLRDQLRFAVSPLEVRPGSGIGGPGPFPRAAPSRTTRGCGTAWSRWTGKGAC